jgi:diguanylate cyclase (GGDEF)-like protein
MRGLFAGVGMVIVVNEGKLSAVLSEFARTLATDFPIQRILDHLVARIVEVLPISAAGVTLISEGRAPRYVAASDLSALRFERLQTELGEGPCLTAYETGQAVGIPDLGADDLFPRFAPAAIAAGLGAVFTFPLHGAEGRLGALDLYRDAPGELDQQDMAAAQTLADVAAAYLLNAQARDEARATSDYFRHGAQHDSLTGLPNRLLLAHRLTHAAQRAKRSHTHAAILFADLDRFKQVNDTYGHQVGDELLLAVAHRLSSLVRPGDTLARFSGDEFVFLCEDLTNPADAEDLAARIDEAFAEPFALTRVELSVTASVGMAYAGPGQNISAQMLVDADVAMYQAKRKGGAGHQVIDLREAHETRERTSLDRDLRLAFAGDALHVEYQPIVRNADAIVTGVEALLRWTHRTRGSVPARSMIAVAESTGAIREIGAWVLERSCRDHHEWLQEHPTARLDLAVNVSARQLMSQDFCATVLGVLDRTRTDPMALIIEITENVFIEDIDRALVILANLSAIGVRLALDDFGTGYSSLSYLRDLPIDIVKIDQSFIAGIGSDPEAGAIAAAVTTLAHVLDLTVTAEGVETQSQHDEVSALGCDSSQGFYYGKSMSAPAFGAQLDAAGAGPLRLPTDLRKAGKVRLVAPR